MSVSATRARVRAHAMARALSSVSLLVLSGAALAQTQNAPPVQVVAAATDDIEQVYVWGKREDTIGEAQTASEGVVDFALFEDRPILRPGEIAEVIPGLAVTQHSGSGKANQYFMRGFNLDHGTDFSVSFDGVPMNLPTHGHGQGYLDLNAITPEMIQTIEYRKGPYFADVGDFSAAGTARFVTFDEAPAPYAEITAGEHDYYRLLGTAPLGEKSYVALDATSSQGPWVNPENVRKLNVLGHFALDNWAVTALAYTNRWNSTDQIPERAMDDGTISRLGYIDPSDGGKTERFILSVRNHDLAGWDVVVFAQKYDLQLWSDFTYFLDDPVHGDQFEQEDHRWVYGGSLAKSWQVADGWTFSGGAQLRYDDIGKVALYHTEKRVQLETVRSDAVQEWNAALWAQADRKFGPLRVTVGVRYTGVGVDVSSDDPLNSGSKTESTFSPKLTLAWEISPQWELYADAGRGFHTNDGRGAVERVVPGTSDPATPAPLIVPAVGGEIGSRWSVGNWTATATLFWLHLDSELTYSGDAGDTESGNATQRIGGEFLINWHPIPRIDIDASAATTHARYTGYSPDGDRIPNAIEYMLTGGISALITDNLTATLTVRHLGPSPLTGDGVFKSRAATDTNFLLRYQWDRFTFTGELLNVFDSKDDDIEYYYTSRLPGEPADGVDDYHIHPMEPRTWRLGARLAL